jgi:hypothetical protein
MVETALIESMVYKLTETIIGFNRLSILGNTLLLKRVGIRGWR